MISENFLFHSFHVRMTYLAMAMPYLYQVAELRFVHYLIMVPRTLNCVHMLYKLVYCTNNSSMYAFICIAFVYVVVFKIYFDYMRPCPPNMFHVYSQPVPDIRKYVLIFHFLNLVLTSYTLGKKHHIVLLPSCGSINSFTCQITQIAHHIDGT